MKNDPNAKTELERKLEEEIRAESENESTEDDDIVAADIAIDDSNEIDEVSEPQEPTIESITRELEAAQDQLLRMRAEFDNYRKRMAREAERIRKRAAESLIMDLLPVVDNLDLALQHADDSTAGFAEGVAMVMKQLSGLLGEHGLAPISAVGETFDPRIHEAVSQLESNDVETDTIAQEFQRGYMLGDQVLRPSKVAVSKGPPETMNEETIETAADDTQADDTQADDAQADDAQADQAREDQAQAAGAASSSEKEQSNG